MLYTTLLISLTLMVSTFSVSYAYPGCNDSLADNYDPNATSNNNSCIYCAV